MAQEDRMGGGTYRRFDDEPKENNWGLRVVLFALLLCACYFIVMYSGKRTEIVAETEEYTVERSVRNPGNLRIKEDNFFGDVVEVPMNYTEVVKCYCNDGVTLDVKVRYVLNDNLTVGELFYIHDKYSLINANIKNTIRLYTSKRSAEDLYNNQKGLMDTIQTTAIVYGLETLQVETHFNKTFQELMTKKKMLEVDDAISRMNKRVTDDIVKMTKIAIETKMKAAKIEAARQAKKDALLNAELAIAEAEAQQLKAMAQKESYRLMLIDSMKQVFENQLKEGILK